MLILIYIRITDPWLHGSIKKRSEHINHHSTPQNDDCNTASSTPRNHSNPLLVSSDVLGHDMDDEIPFPVVVILYRPTPDLGISLKSKGKKPLSRPNNCP